jgi:trehalose 6-phosphate phosphatase
MRKTPRKTRASIRRSAASRRPRESSSAARRDAGFPEGSVPELTPGTAFFLDVDGTLVEFADRPHEVRIDDDLGRLLTELHSAAGGALALISGRSVSDVDRLFASRRFCIAGQHGAERRDAAGMVHRHGLPLARLRSAGDTLRQFSAAHPALVLEDKGMNLALHYRLAPHLASNVQGAVQDIVKDLGEDFEVQQGKMVFEIKPSGKDKGTAIAEFVKEKPFRDRMPVFIGDDDTDEYGFRIVNRLGGHSVKVGGGSTTARWRLPDASAVRAWLWRFIEHGRLDS